MGVACPLLEESIRPWSKGVGAQKRQAEPLTEADEEKLWETRQLGAYSPQSLVSTIVYMCGVYFDLRSG